MSDETEARREWELTRRCMAQVYTSHIQTHAGLLIAIIIGAFTLISRFADFYKTPNDTLTFGLLLSLLTGVSFYVLGRFFYWIFFDGMTVWVTFVDIQDSKKHYIEKSHPKSVIKETELKVEDIPNTEALSNFIRYYSKKPYLRLYHKFATLSTGKLLIGSIGVTMASFLAFLFINGFLRQL